MTGKITQSTYELGQEFLEGVDLGSLVNDADVLLAPDQVTRQGEDVFLGFRPDTQELRIVLKEAGLRVELLKPPHAKTARYMEHDVTWVIPLVVAVAGTAAGNLVSDWVKEKLRRHRAESPTERIRLRYRIGSIDLSSGKVAIREIEGDADEVVRVLDADDRSAPPPD